jgi:hypothetical protein
MSGPIERYIGLDTHKAYCVVGAVDSGQEVVLSPRRVNMNVLEHWARQHLNRADAVVLEASGNA